MRIDLWELTKKAEKEQTVLTIEERLPAWLEEPCTVSVDYAAKVVDDYYLFTITTKAELGVYCQRCGQLFHIPYKNTLELAICDNEIRAESLTWQYESLTALHGRVDLEDLVTDELHLYAPQTHINVEDCDQQIDAYLIENNTL